MIRLAVSGRAHAPNPAQIVASHVRVIALFSFCFSPTQFSLINLAKPDFADRSKSVSVGHFFELARQIAHSNVPSILSGTNRVEARKLRGVSANELLVRCRNQESASFRKVAA